MQGEEELGRVTSISLQNSGMAPKQKEGDAEGKSNSLAGLVVSNSSYFSDNSTCHDSAILSHAHIWIRWYIEYINLKL